MVRLRVSVKGATPLSLKSPVVNEERMRLVGDFCVVVVCASSFLLVGWQEDLPARKTTRVTYSAKVLI